MELRGIKKRDYFLTALGLGQNGSCLGTKLQVSASPCLFQRLRAVEGDLFKDPIPAGHDVVLIANVTHLLSAERNLVFASAHPSVRARRGAPATCGLLDGRDPHPACVCGVGFKRQFIAQVTEPQAFVNAS